MVFQIGFEPFDGGAVHLRLKLNVQVAGGQQCLEVRRRDADEILALHHFAEMLTGVAVGHVHQVHPVVTLCEGADGQTVGGVEVCFHVFTAGPGDQLHLQDTRRVQQRLHVIHRQRQSRGVREAHQVLDGIRIEISDLNQVLFGLGHFGEEHGPKVRYHAGQNQFVAWYQSVPNLE